MPRQDAVWLNLQVSQEEKDILTEYAHSNRKSRVEVVREFIRSLQPDDNLDEGLWKIAADITQVENEILEEYCYNTNQKKSDVIRSLIRSLRVERGENSHAVMRVYLGKTEAKLLDDYCSRNNTTPTSAIRQLIRDTDSNDLETINKRMELKESDWRATFDTTNKSTATGVGQKFLRSMSSTKPGTDVYFIEENSPIAGEFEPINSASVATVARQLRTLADDLENQAGDLDKLADQLEGVE